MVVDLVALELAELESVKRLGESSWCRRIQSRSFCHEILLPVTALHRSNRHKREASEK